MRAESVTLVEESEGFELSILDVDGEYHSFNVHGCLDDLEVVGKLIADYWAEGRRLAAEHERDMAALAYEESRDEMLNGLGEIDGGGA